MIDGRQKRMISKTAEQLLQAHNFWQVGFDVEALLSSLGIRLSLVEDLEDSISGFSVASHGKRTIGIRKSEYSTSRGRFTLAHELGHLTLHQNSMVNYGRAEVFFRHNRGPEKNSAKEYEANYFAACLLMPEKLVQNEVNKFLLPEIGLTSEEIENIALTFNVSVAAMTTRLSQLGYSLF